MGILFYRKVRNNNSQSKGYGKWYALAKTTQTVGIEEIATTMQDSCTVKRADILAVLSELGPTMASLMKDSKRVRIPYLGCFKLGLKSKSEANLEKFNVRDNILGVRVLFQPESRAGEKGTRVKLMAEGVVFGEWGDVVKAKSAQEGTENAGE